MNRKRFAPLIIILILAVIIVLGGITFYKSKSTTPFSQTISIQSSPTPIPLSQSSSSHTTKNCDIAAIDFGNRKIESDSYGELDFRNGTYIQFLEGNPEWEFTIATSSTIFSFGSDVVRIIYISGDHLGGSGSPGVALGYMCSNEQVKKVMDQPGFSFTKTGVNELSMTVLGEYRGAASPGPSKTIKLMWDHQKETFMMISGNN